MANDWQNSGQQPIPPGGGGGGTGGSSGKGKRIAIIAALLVTVTGLLVGGGLVLVNRSNSETAASNATYVIMDDPAPNVTPVFQPRDARGPDPFFPLEVQQVSFQSEAMEEAQAQAQGDDAVEIDPADFEVERLTEQTKTGLYGGTAENTCKPERLIAFLLENPELGQAWAQVQGIAFAEIPSYIRSLEVRVLAAPVEVLNHGYNEITGQAYEIDSTLDVGTAVLVDANGDIRTRCYCGNPIRPKPPADPKPPACLVIPLQVYLAPDSSISRIEAPNTVFTTGRTASYEGRTWAEVMWGTQTNEMGWTLRSNLQPRIYCRPATPPPGCPAGNGVTVYRVATGDETLGTLGAPEGSLAGGGRLVPVSATADGEQVIVNGRILIHFGHPTLTAAAGWVDLSDIDFAGDPARCEPIRACFDLSVAATKPGNAGPVPGVGAGTQLVEITGRFSQQLGSAPDNEDATEVKLLEHGGQRAWVPSSALTLLADEQCDAPTTLCKASSVSPLGDLLWSSATASLAIPELPGPDEPALTDEQVRQILADFATLDFSVVRGYAGSVEITLIGSSIPTNGRLEVQVGTGGPTGWIDAATLTGGKCLPMDICITLSAGVFSNYKDAGSILAGTPGEALQVQLWAAIAFNFGSDAGTGLTMGFGNIDLDQIYFHIGVGGARGWVPLSSISDALECDPPKPPVCPTNSIATADNETGCCITYNGATETVSITGRQENRSGITFIEVTADGGPPFWIETAAFRAAGDCDDVPVACPVLPAGTAQTSELERRCCAALEQDGSLTFIEVDLTGETTEADGLTSFATVDNGTITQGDFVSAQFCTTPPADTPTCEEGQAELLPGLCCVSGQEIVNGQCADPCPAGQSRNNAGGCITPCPTGQSRNSAGTCITPCPTGQSRTAAGECFTPCPDGSQPTATGCSATPCPTGFDRLDGDTCVIVCAAGSERVQADRCCPTGTELVDNQCTQGCPEGQRDDGVGGCEFDCAAGQVTLLGECCPSNTRPTGEGACTVPCATQLDRLGTCCPTGQTVDPQTELCPTPCPSDRVTPAGTCCAESQEIVNDQCQTPCPAGTVRADNDQCEQPCASGLIAPADDECCFTGEVLDPGGFCNDPCPNNNFTSDGACCPSGTEAVGTQCELICTSGLIAPADDECCFTGEVLDLGGFCNDPCPNNNFTSDGACCASGTEAVGTQCLAPCTSPAVRYNTTECCPNDGLSAVWNSLAGTCDALG